MQFVNHNGGILSVGDARIGIANRAFRYGDSLFETFRVFEGKMPFLDAHAKRLTQGLEMLGYEIPLGFGMDFMEKQSRMLIGDSGNHRVRWMVYRGGEGLYSPISNRLAYLVEAFPLAEATYTFPERGLRVGIIAERLLHPSPLSALKTGSALPYVFAARRRQARGWDEALLLNHEGFVVEALSSNIIVIKGGDLWIPRLGSGQVSGVLQGLLTGSLGIPLRETDLSPRDVATAEGLLLCNAIQGIRWVASCGERRYPPPPWGGRLTAALNTLLD